MIYCRPVDHHDLEPPGIKITIFFQLLQIFSSLCFWLMLVKLRNILGLNNCWKSSGILPTAQPVFCSNKPLQEVNVWTYGMASLCMDTPQTEVSKYIRSLGNARKITSETFAICFKLIAFSNTPEHPSHTHSHICVLSLSLSHHLSLASSLLHQFSNSFLRTHAGCRNFFRCAKAFFV